MKCTISQDNLIKIIEWIFFIGFSILAGIFAFGVLQQFFLQKTSFSQLEETVNDYPVVTIILLGHKASEVNQSNVIIRYWVGGKTFPNFFRLDIGLNHIHNDQYNITEKVTLESLENNYGNRAFRIIHSTPMISDGYSPKIKIYTKLEKKNDSDSDLVEFFLTSLDNSPGFYYYYWKDGRQFQIEISKNTQIKYAIQTQITNYLEKIGKCQKDSYYNCIASHLDAIEFDKCPNKCIPEIFSNMGKNYAAPFCQNDSHNQRQCVLKHMYDEEVWASCKRSCSITEYLGQPYLNIPIKSDEEDWDLYYFKYRINQLASTKDEYLIYLWNGGISGRSIRYQY